MTIRAPRWLRALRQGPVAGFFLDLLLALLAMLALLLLAMTAWSLLHTARPALGFNMDRDGSDLLAAVVASTVSTGGAALLLYWWRRRASAAEIAASSASALRLRTWAWAAATGVATYLASGSITALAQQLGIEPQPTNVAMIEATMVAHPIVLFVVAVVLAPAYEELLFRRVLFGRLWSAGRPLLGLVLSSAVFALMHELPGSGGNGIAATAWLWLVYSAMGAAYAALYWHTRTLWAPIAAHALNNALALGALKLYGGN